MQKLTFKAHSMGGSVPMGELFTPEFMKANSDCEGIDELFTAGGFNVQSWADLEAITDEQMDPVVRQHKKFISWQEFTQAVRWKALELNVAQDNYEHPLVRVARDVAEKPFVSPVWLYTFRLSKVVIFHS